MKNRYLMYSFFLLGIFSQVVLLAMGNQSSAEVSNASTIVSVAHIDVMPQGVSKVENPFRTYLANCAKEPGEMEIHFYQQIGAPNHFTLIEIWSSKKTYEDHVAAETTRAFRKSIAAYLGSPYDERLHTEKLEFSP